MAATPASVMQAYDALPISAGSMRTDCSPFFSIAKCDRFREYASVAVSASGTSDISWEYWNDDWSMDALQGVIKELSLTKSVYIGVTESPIWRWDYCRSHGETEMKAHSDHYDAMYVLCVDCTECIQVVEELLLQQSRLHPDVCMKILNDPVYRPGPLNRNGVLYLYVCTI